MRCHKEGKGKYYSISGIDIQSAFVSCVYKHRICKDGICQNANSQ